LYGNVNVRTKAKRGWTGNRGRQFHYSSGTLRTTIKQRHELSRIRMAIFPFAFFSGPGNVPSRANGETLDFQRASGTPRLSEGEVKARYGLRGSSSEERKNHHG